MIKIKKTHSSKNKYFKREFGTHNFIPYLCHWDKSTILTKKKELMKVIKISGFSFETADDEDVDLRKNVRNLLFKGMSTGSIMIYSHIIRRKRSILPENMKTYDPNIKMEHSFADYVEKKWNAKYSSQNAFVNDLYFTIIKRDDTKGAAYFEHLFKKMQRADKSFWEEDMKESYEQLEETTSRVINTLRNYQPEILCVKETENGAFCEIMEFLGTIVNCGNSSPLLMPSRTIDKYLPMNRLYFGKKSIEVMGHDKNQYAGLISVKEYGPNTYAGIFDGFLQMPFEFIMTQSLSFINRQIAIKKMQLQKNRLAQAEDKAVSQIFEIDLALDDATSGKIAFGDHHLTVLCIENSPKSLENAISLATVELSNGGLVPVRETYNMEACYWGQLPGNHDFIARKSVINTYNFAGYSSFHNYPSGKQTGNFWGEYVTVFDTTSGTPYFFNFHLRDVGHTVIIGPTGAGKTVLMNFLCAQAQKFACRMFYFDKDRGAEIFIRAIKGHYNIINPGVPCGFNPLHLPNTGPNRTFLLDWLKLLVTVNGEVLTSEDIALLSSAINGNYKLKFADRKLSNIAAFLGIEGPGTLAGRLAMWHGRGSHANVFDNQEDTLDLTKGMSFGFEMAEILKDTICLGPILLYLFHRINISLDGTRTMIVLDEAWSLIDNPIFAPKIKDWLKVLRKLNTFVIFATQSVEDASKSQISDTLIQQTATQIFLPNLKATNVYRDAFLLSEREHILIKTTDPGSRFFIVKQGTNAVVARIDLTGMDEIIKVLSGTGETVRILDKIRQEVGDDPDHWLPIFYQKTGAKDG